MYQDILIYYVQNVPFHNAKYIMLHLLLRISGGRSIKDKQQQCQINKEYVPFSLICPQYCNQKINRNKLAETLGIKSNTIFPTSRDKTSLSFGGKIFCEGEEKDRKGQQNVINNLSECFRSNWITCNIPCNVKFLLSFNVPSLKNLSVLNFMSN